MITNFKIFEKINGTINLKVLHKYFIDSFPKYLNQGEREYYKFLDKILTGKRILFFSDVDDKIISVLVNKVFSSTADGLHIIVNKGPTLKNVDDWMKTTTFPIPRLHGIYGENELDICIKYDNSDVIIEDPSEETKKYLKDIFSQLKGKQFDL